MVNERKSSSFVLETKRDNNHNQTSAPLNNRQNEMFLFITKIIHIIYMSIVQLAKSAVQPNLANQFLLQQKQQQHSNKKMVSNDDNNNEGSDYKESLQIMPTRLFSVLEPTPLTSIVSGGGADGGADGATTCGVGRDAVENWIVVTNNNNDIDPNEDISENTYCPNDHSFTHLNQNSITLQPVHEDGNDESMSSYNHDDSVTLTGITNDWKNNNNNNNNDDKEYNNNVTDGNESNHKLQVKDLQFHKILGEGQFGQVWLTSINQRKKKVNNHNNSLVAVKILSKYRMTIEGTTTTNTAIDDIVREIQILHEISNIHPCLIHMIDTIHDDNLIYIIQEFCAGGELFTLVHNHTNTTDNDNHTNSRMMVQNAKFYAACIVDAIHHLHQHNIIYRDLKPENIVIRHSTGYPVLIDYGYAKHLRITPRQRQRQQEQQRTSTTSSNDDESCSTTNISNKHTIVTTAFPSSPSSALPSQIVIQRHQQDEEEEKIMMTTTFADKCSNGMNEDDECWMNETDLHGNCSSDDKNNSNNRKQNRTCQNIENGDNATNNPNDPTDNFIEESQIESHYENNNTIMKDNNEEEDDESTIGSRCYSMVGTPKYIAPEVILGIGYDSRADLWSLGIVIYELLAGYNPMEGPTTNNSTELSELELFRCITEEDYVPLPSNIIESVHDSSEDDDCSCNDHSVIVQLIDQLLVRDPDQRLQSSELLLQHQWFRDIDFNLLRKQQLVAPWIPQNAIQIIMNDHDIIMENMNNNTSNNNNNSLNNLSSFYNDASITSIDTQYFDNWDYIAEDPETCIFKDKYPKLSNLEQEMFASIDLVFQPKSKTH